MKQQRKRPDESTGTNRRIVFLSLLSTFVTSFMGSALNLSIPDIGKEFGISAAQVALVITAYMLTCTALPVLFGRLADLIQRKWILTAGLGVFTAASAGGALASSMQILLLFRLLQGAGTAMIYSTSMSVLVAAAPESLRNKMLGYSTAATYLGLSAGPAAGGMLNQYAGWRWIFAATAAASAVAFFCALRELRSQEPQKTFSSGKIPPSGFSCFLYVCSVSILIFGLSMASRSAWGWLAAGAGTAGFLYYLCRDWHTGRPLLPVDWIWTHKVFLLANLAALLNYGTNFVLNYHLSVYLQTGMGFSSQKAGLILVISPAVQAVLSIFAGKMQKRTSPQILSALGMAGTGTVVLGFAMLKPDTPLWVIMMGLAAAGASCALFAAPNSAVIFQAAGTRQYSMASSVISTVRSMGHTLCMAVSSIITGIYIGAEKLEAASSEQILDVMQSTFFLFGGGCILGIFMAMKKKV